MACPNFPVRITERLAAQLALVQYAFDVWEPDEGNQVKRAYYFAEQAHHGQFRRSGEPYLTHVLVVADILADLRLDVDTLIAGLVHDVGAIAILNYVQKYPELAQDEVALEETIDRMRGELGSMILRKWNFPPAVVAGARDAETWLRRHDRGADFTDLLVVAQVHERLRKHQLDGLPPMDKISAIQRVLGDDATPERSLEILHEAKSQVDETRSVLRG